METSPLAFHFHKKPKDKVWASPPRNDVPLVYPWRDTGRQGNRERLQRSSGDERKANWILVTVNSDKRGENTGMVLSPERIGSTRTLLWISSTCVTRTLPGRDFTSLTWTHDIVEANSFLSRKKECPMINDTVSSDDTKAVLILFTRLGNQRLQYQHGNGQTYCTSHTTDRTRHLLQSSTVIHRKSPQKVHRRSSSLVHCQPSNHFHDFSAHTPAPALPVRATCRIGVSEQPRVTTTEVTDFFQQILCKHHRRPLAQVYCTCVRRQFIPGN